MRVLPTIHLSDTQKQVLVLTKAAPTPQVAFEELRKTPSENRANIIGARNILEKLGLIEVGPDSIEITPEGEKALQDEYLVDEMGEFTEEANKYLEKSSENINQQTNAPPPSEEPPMPDMGDMEEPNPFESLGLIRTLQDQSKLLVD